MYPNLEDFKVSPQHGFITINNNLSLPAYFNGWKEIALNIRELLNNKDLRRHVDELALLDYNKLETYRQYEIAHLYLSTICNGYVWQYGDKNPSKVLPRQIAVPLCGVSLYLGVKPIMSHISQCLNNIRVVDIEKPLDAENMKTNIQHLGDNDYEWFCVITGLVEVKAAKGIQACVKALKATEQNDKELVIENINKMTDSLVDMKHALERMHERLSPSIFFNVIRIYLAGWGTDGSPLPKGLIYEDVFEDPQVMAGGSAAQSSTFQTFDVTLGIQHTPKHQKFLNMMRNYMPRIHREFIEAIAKEPSLKDYVKICGNLELSETYDKCIQTLTDLRTYHVNLVAKYVVVESHKDKSKEDYEGHLDARGTGGSDIFGFLKNVRDTTKETQLS